MRVLIVPSLYSQQRIYAIDGFFQATLDRVPDRVDHAAENIGDDDLLEVHQVQDLIGERKDDREQRHLQDGQRALGDLEIAFAVTDRHVIRAANERTLARVAHVVAESAVIAGIIVRDVVVARPFKIYSVGMIERGVVSRQDILIRRVQVQPIAVRGQRDCCR